MNGLFRKPSTDDTFVVRTDVDPNYLQNALTKDITTLESIYDLVDNCIDAARNTLLSSPACAFDRYGLPASYSGFCISLHFGDGWIAILDNAFGIDEDTLANRTLRPGTESSHRFGIGRFGIGLKRALMKLGKRYWLSTDTGAQASMMAFKREQLGGPELIAQRVSSKGRQKTLICIKELESMVSHETSTPNWKETAIRELSRRYGIFVSKGLRIYLNGAQIPSFGPCIRDSGPVTHQTESDEIDGVRIFIDAGMHQDYRISDEPSYERSVNKKLTDQYGWYFVCNDRIVEVATHQKSLGWTGKWHQEYYGFVGWVRFVSEELATSGELPWDTKKTSINPYSPAFVRIADQLQAFAERYKKENKAARPDKGGGESAPPTPPGQPSPPDARPHPGPTSPPSPAPSPSPSPSPPSDADHNENWGALFPPVGVDHNHDKLKALVVEASALEATRPYAATMLFRAIFELALFQYVKRAGRFNDVATSVFEDQERNGRPFTEEQKGLYAPTLAIMVTWVLSNSDIFPVEYRRECTTALQHFKKHLPGIQKVVHETAMTSSEKIKTIRNDCWPVIKYILENDPGKKATR
ncbi:hypothetical protein CU669_11900 [Paramagnetospirillum kuznetsovii]|uniref:ATP-binding protein n=1 Tax=Paramagnetospirillum kuznetsovii TaxID=2053833 RepID=A0A364NXP4_9PROT|nr:ATP-binding protein [Paramagnetospirillum kuznetsovii]RAU21675.1 hypothetical protein CU669_11900 [Paramagnetospirillum kuznetsovii]